MSELDVLFKYNCSTIFLLYPLAIERRKIMQLGFIQAFLFDSEKMDVEYENPVFLLFKPDSPTVFQAFVESEYERINKFTGTVDIIEDYDYIDGYVVLVYQFPKEFEVDYKKFLEGKYSKFSKKFKDAYPKTVKIRTEEGRMIDEVGTVFRIINRTKDFRDMLEERLGVTFDWDQELWNKYNETKETLSYEKIRKLEGKEA